MLDKTLKQLLEPDHKFLNIVIDALPIPVFIKGNEGIYLGCNSAFEDFIGMNCDVMTGQSVYDLYPREEADLPFNKDKELLDNSGVQADETDISTITGQQGIVGRPMFLLKRIHLSCRLMRHFIMQRTLGVTVLSSMLLANSYSTWMEISYD
ncbi:MAG: PAS domain-containing protein [Pseudomonadota bacterium]|nr:PAS domain-containing protein [Pseudomonadota bacterium]